MRLSAPSRPSLLDLTEDAELVVEGERMSLLSAAANARSVAMLTGTHGVIAMPIDLPRVKFPTPAELAPEGFVVPEAPRAAGRDGASARGDGEAEAASERGDGASDADADDERPTQVGAESARADDDPLPPRLRVIAAVAASRGDTVGEIRARLDIARLARDNGDDVAARAEAERIAELAPTSTAVHALLRALRSGRRDIDAQLGHVAVLVAGAPSAAVRADWIAERARLVEAKGGPAESCAIWAEALANDPDHVGALYGYEAALDATGDAAGLAAHLGRLAELAEEPAMKAWLAVERALLLDRRLGDEAGARALLVAALALTPGKGPVREACVDHAVAHRDDAWLASLLASEAAFETDPARAARLELDAGLAIVASDPAGGTLLLERALSRAPTTLLTDRRVVAELTRLYRAEGRDADVARVLNAGLGSVASSAEELVVLRAVAAHCERAGDPEGAIAAIERARTVDPEDATLLSDLDRLVAARAARAVPANGEAARAHHEARCVLWLREAARVPEADKKARALMQAALAAKAAGRDGDAARHLQSAWVTAPDAPGIYDALAERLAPHATRESVAARVALYEQAARATPEPDKKILFLEKVAWLWDDVGGDAALAAKAYEDVLAIEPARLSAITGLASSALRAGDMKALARAQRAEADVTADLATRAELKLRAAETLAGFDPDRALALAEELRDDTRVAARAAALVTRLHATAGRFELVAKTLDERRRAYDAGTYVSPDVSDDPAVRAEARFAIVRAHVDVLLSRLNAPAIALDVLDAIAPGPGVDAAVLATVKREALEALGDEARLRAGLEALAEATPSARTKGELWLRAAELDARRGDADAQAALAYARALEALPDDPLVVARLVRLGARTPLPEAQRGLALPLARAVRTLETKDETGDAEELLASGARDFATLRMAERRARRAKREGERRTMSAPQLANAIALQIDAFAGVMSRRALAGLASLVAWTLPEGNDVEPWDRMVATGTADVAVLDTFVFRARAGVQRGDIGAITGSIAAARRRLETAADETERIALRLDIARLHRRARAYAPAVTECRHVLEADPGSFGAAALLAELATDLGDRSAGILAARTIASLTVSASARASLLRDAADLASAAKDKATSAALLEEALDADPDAVDVAARLADLRAQLGHFSELARALQRALRNAKKAEAIVPMASELADVARNRLRDPMLAIEALERSRAVAPRHVPTLFLLGELYIGQRAWDLALDALADVVPATEDRAEKLVAIVGRASIYRRVLEHPAYAERELRLALEIDPHDARALRGLLEIGTAVTPNERATLLSRLVVAETGPAERVAVLLELAKARRAINDVDGAEGAIVEAAALAPDDAMLGRIRTAAEGQPGAVARILARAVGRARDLERPFPPSWLVALGDLEMDLGRVEAAIEHFEEALALDANDDKARFALARALSRGGRHETAFAALLPLLEAPPVPRPLDVGFARQLETSLAGAGRTQQAHVARELRALAGDLDAQALGDLEGRRLVSSPGDGLPASSLRSFVMPGGLGRHPIWDVAPVAAAFAGKVARVPLNEQGATTRDRVKPKTLHPVRALVDRMARIFEILEIEVAVSEHVAAPAIACEDVPWIIVPAAIADWPEHHAVAALARPFVRIALGVPWLGVVPSNEVLAILVAFARQVAPSFGATPAPRIEPSVDEYALRARRAVDRRRRRVLEELEPALSRAPAIDERSFVEAVARTEARAAFLLSGHLRASLGALASTEPTLEAAIRVPSPDALRGALTHPASRDLVAYALGGEATALRNSLGTIRG